MRSRRGFLGALGGLGVAAVATLTPAAAEIVKAGEKYGDDIIRDAYQKGMISEETAQEFLSTPLRTMTAHQVAAVESNTITKGTKAHLDAVYRLVNATHDEKMHTLCLLTWAGETFEGPLCNSYTEEDDPFAIVFNFKYECDTVFTYDGIQIVTHSGDVLPPAKFSYSPSVAPGDLLDVNWTLSI